MPSTSSAEWTPLPLSAVTIDDGFWSPRRETVRSSTLPQQEAQLREDGHLAALTLAWRPGDAHEPHIFWESDVAKWIEAASYALAKHPDPTLDAAVDEVIELLDSAQQPDGYLNVYFTVVRPGQRFTDLRDAHELYCAGHLIEAGVAHHEATGKRTLLDIVIRYADLIEREFGPGGPLEGGYDGHQEIELALVKLARATGERRYLALAKQFVDARGQQPYFFDLEEQRRGNPGYFDDLFPGRANDVNRYREYNQSHVPVREQRDAVGHSVRAMYLYSAMADLAGELGDAELADAVKALWVSVTERKMYVTGGIGSDHSIEGFEGDFVLPEDSYAETCASIGLVLWAHRMTLLTGESRYADVLERALYNGVLSGASSEGTHYFYSNPMASDGSIHRNEWFGVACCPPNYARLLSSLEQYIYARSEDTIAVNLFVGSTARFDLAATAVAVTQSTGLPLAGDVLITVEPDVEAEFSLAVRIPDWAEHAEVRVNGEDDSNSSTSRGYRVITRRWSPGDTVELRFPMLARRVRSDPRVAATAGKVALARGPFIYCVEGLDVTVPLAMVSLPRDAQLETVDGTDGALPWVTADGISSAPNPPVSNHEGVTSTEIRALPYFAWANRGQSTMKIWLPER